MSGFVKKEDAIRICKMCASAKYRVPYIEQAFENISAIDAVSEWIPCSERLPKGQGYYICTCKDGSKYKRATVVKWSNGWQLTGARAYWIVLAWMPLPNPWKGADDEAD